MFHKQIVTLPSLFHLFPSAFSSMYMFYSFNWKPPILLPNKGASTYQVTQNFDFLRLPPSDGTVMPGDVYLHSHLNWVRNKRNSEVQLKPKKKDVPKYVSEVQFMRAAVSIAASAALFLVVF